LGFQINVNFLFFDTNIPIPKTYLKGNCKGGGNIGSHTVLKLMEISF